MELEMLVAEMVEARRDRNSNQIRATKRALLDYLSPFEELNREATNAHDAACIEDLESAVSEFSKIAARIGQDGGVVKSGLERARKAAASGKKELLIPKVAEASSKALAELKELKNGIDKFVQQAGDVHNLNDVNNLLPEVITTLGKLQTATGNIGVQIPGNLAGMAQTVADTLTELEVQKDSIQQFVQAAGDVHDLQDVSNLLPEAISKLEALKQAAKDVGIQIQQ